MSPCGRPRVALVAPSDFSSRSSDSGSAYVSVISSMSITGIGKARVHQHVAEVVHVDEAVGVRVAVDARERACESPAACRVRTW